MPIDLLLDSDPAIRWQVLRDLTDAPAREVAAERPRARKGDATKTVVVDAEARYFGTALATNSLVTPD